MLSVRVIDQIDVFFIIMSYLSYDLIILLVIYELQNDIGGSGSAETV
jgi:hypothetical protein